MDDLSDPMMEVVIDLDERNRIAQTTIDEFAIKHAAIDVGLGFAGLIPVPGAATVALITAMGLQFPIIYQPLAEALSDVYLAPPKELMHADRKIVRTVWAETAVVDVVNEFGIQFFKEIGTELVLELGFGGIATTIPVLGACFAAGLDYAIANKMTRRVGRMVSIYFQNGARWCDTKKKTYETAKNLDGDLTKIRDKVSSVREFLLRNVRLMIDLMHHSMNTTQMREALKAKGVPVDLIDEALGTT